MGFLSLLFFSSLLIFSALGWAACLFYHSSLRRVTKKSGLEWPAWKHREMRNMLNDCFARICDFQIAALIGLIGDVLILLWYANLYSNFL